MSDPIEAGARAAAQRLTSSHGPDLATDVEVALHTRGATARPGQYLDPISLGSLIVSIASLAWTVYSDLKKETPAPQREVVARHVRVRLGQGDSAQPALSPADQDRFIDITVEETLGAAGGTGSGEG
ncbi:MULTISPECIES: hypothetical protein [Streptomyces]|uniref:Uncharacterized protein n=1 Tax=Streptomyces solicathayae TaxID=3081768 RepID=A0ABZ0LWI9_9ACTN|nr:hypothetical protein [Streptomyces sp. HUAS YS2]WOX23832.1 hypothetical protein R2D22_21565 [Streptomyces sp. HUAS YS2]